MAKLGRQTPTFTNVAYESTLGHDAADLYHETGQELVKWQCLQVEAIMATDEDNLWKNMKYGLAFPGGTAKEKSCPPGNYMALSN